MLNRWFGMTNPLQTSRPSVDMILVSRLISLSDSWEQTYMILGIEFSISNICGFGFESPTSALMPVPRKREEVYRHKAEGKHSFFGTQQSNPSFFPLFIWKLLIFDHSHCSNTPIPLYTSTSAVFGMSHSIAPPP